ncbi:hypothetical protein [Acinetobacter pittii]|uniref:hypothetical protein n=1 Tax=Acinetobacter pittii TaxID=48296 RepID=UPI002A02CD8F|nr:hypothetical protein [Acinetobacter pittii]MDX8162143.1 hypothetical protein [Acinetobacter pittii]
MLITSFNKKFLITICSSLIVGCAANSGIVPMGNNTYMVSRQAATGFSGMGTLKAEAMREAYQECQKTNKFVNVLETIDAKPPYILGNFPKTEIRFKCINENKLSHKEVSYLFGPQLFHGEAKRLLEPKMKPTH